MKGHLLFLSGLVPLIIFTFWPGVEYIVLPGWQTVMVPAISTYTVAALMLLVIMGLVYWWLHKMHRKTNSFLTLLHFILTFLPIYFLIWQVYLNTLVGFGSAVIPLKISMWSYLLLSVAQGLFLGNVSWSLIKRKKE